MNYLEKIKSFLRDEDIFKEEAIKGCNSKDIASLKGSTDKEIPDAVLDYLLAYGKSDHPSLNLNRIYDRLVKQQQYTRLFQKMKEEYEKDDSFFEIDQLNEREMLFFFWNGGGHGDYMMSFVYPISDANPTVYHYVEGELEHTNKRFSDYVLKMITASVGNHVRRIKFDAKNIDDYHRRTQFIKVSNISKLKLEIDLGHSAMSIPDEIRNCKAITELTFKGGSYDEIEPLIRNNRDSLIKLTLSGLSHFPQEFDLPFGKELEELSLFGEIPQKLIIDPKNYPKLKTLVMNSSGLSALPEAIVDIGSLEYLQLMKTQITTIPIFLSKSKKLTSLDFWGCQICQIPPDIERFQHLEFLNLSNNYIEEEDLSLVKRKLPNTRIWDKHQRKK